MRFLLTILTAALLAWPAAAQETKTLSPWGDQGGETLYLSGRGGDDAVDWEFFVTAGRRSGQWTTIPVPSQWELHGFGEYNYGHDERQSDEEGRYRHRFRVPESWQGRHVELVFDGVMTDAEVRLNGSSVGPPHQGAFYRFRYDVTALVDFAGENLLEVTVRKKSADKSVNRAERDADYWIFGGIFRPVFLEASPRESIAHVAVDARHDGTLRARVRLRGLASTARVEARVRSGDGEDLGELLAAETGGDTVELTATIPAVQPWSAETPELYELVVELRRGNALLHRRVERFGFRTIEVRTEEGLFVNDRRVLLKGVNRHSFWPDSGRTLDREKNRRDAELIKSMNMNAVRMSHYPPDPDFLDACDELGLYVLNELAGWHDAYSTGVGRRLVREMVERDVNHPSILFWDNGNEGGWNSALDSAFGEYDIQNRPVLRPDATAAGIDTEHYPDWEEHLESFEDRSTFWRFIFGEPPLVMPTELLHGLYDGGSGAGLAEYWRVIRESPRGAGAFLWVFSDEAVVRTDRDGELDTDGNHAPDGILGPYRELSGNYYAVREVFAPVLVHGAPPEKGFDGAIELENRYDMINLSELRFRWAWVSLPHPFDAAPALVELDCGELCAGELQGPSAAPGGRAPLSFPPPPEGADALRLTAFDPFDHDVGTWVLPRRTRAAMIRPWIETVTSNPAEPREENGRLILGRGDVVFDLETGQLVEFGGLPLNGPYLLPDAGDVPLAAVHHQRKGTAYELEVRPPEGLKTVRWTYFPSGWLRMSYEFEARGKRDLFGVGFPLPDAQVRSFEWLGLGPARVWKNRREGGVLGAWKKERTAETPVEAAHEPKLAGYYAGVYWVRITTDAGRFVVVLEDGDVDLGILTPRFPEDARGAVAAVPDGGLSFLHGISPIGTKFHEAEELGPRGEPHEVDGTFSGTVWLHVDDGLKADDGAED